MGHQWGESRVAELRGVLRGQKERSSSPVLGNGRGPRGRFQATLKYSLGKSLCLEPNITQDTDRL